MSRNYSNYGTNINNNTFFLNNNYRTINNFNKVNSVNNLNNQEQIIDINKNKNLNININNNICDNNISANYLLNNNNKEKMDIIKIMFNTEENDKNETPSFYIFKK